MSRCSYNTGEQYMDVYTELLQSIPTATVQTVPGTVDTRLKLFLKVDNTELHVYGKSFQH